MKSVLTTSNLIHLNSQFNKVLGFTNKDYQAGTRTSEKPVMITTTDKVHLKFSSETIQAEGMGDFFRSVGKAAKNVGKKILNNPGRALEIAANIGTAAASKNPKLIAATAPDIIKFVHQGKGLYLGKIH